MKASLKTSIPCKSVTLFAVIGRAMHRPELGLLCKAALPQGIVTSSCIAKLLPGLSDQGVLNLRRHLEHLELCDRNGALTRQGREVASGQKVLLKEQGVYTLFFVKHQLTGTRPVHLLRERPGDRSFGRDQATELPSWVKEDAHRAWTSLLDPTCTFALQELPSSGGQRPLCHEKDEAPCSLSLEVDLSTGQGGWTLQGACYPLAGQGKKSFRSPLSPVSLDPALLRRDLLPSYDELRGFVPVKYDASFQRSRPFDRDVSLSSCYLEEAGDFSEGNISSVPLGPASSADARAMAAELLKERLDKEPGPIPPARYTELSSAILATNPLPIFGLRPPSAEEFLVPLSSQKSRRTYWHLASAHDLAPTT